MSVFFQSAQCAFFSACRVVLSFLGGLNRALVFLGLALKLSGFCVEFESRITSPFNAGCSSI